MSIERSKSKDHAPLSNSKAGEKSATDKPLTPPTRLLRDGDSSEFSTRPVSSSFNPNPATNNRAQLANGNRAAAANHLLLHSADPEVISPETPANGKAAKKIKRSDKDRDLLSKDRWLVRNGHFVTYLGLYLFSILVLFRPYELGLGLSFLSATAFYLAIATLAIFIPSQLAVEGNLTMFSTEVKAILAMTLVAFVTIPIAKDPALAWDKFNDTYIKAVVIFIVLVNVVRTRQRLTSLMWLSFGIAIYLSFAAINMYLNGQFRVEEYRVAVDVGGMFGNPNEMAMHFVMMTPLVFTLGIASKNRLLRAVYFAATGLFIAANMVTYSRGGFLGLLACSVVLAWKLGRKQRLNVSIASLIAGAIIIVAAPGNYGLRMLSIFIPGLDAVGSSDQRRELLQQSLLVTARNPWGIGIGNSSIVGVRNLQTHNAFTQVSAELGILGLVAYLVFMISPFRKLRAIERTLFDADTFDWFYYFSIGLQASIVGYMVSSFFASVAYNWFIYYLIAYAVAFRRIYSIDKGLGTDVQAPPLWNRYPVASA